MRLKDKYGGKTSQAINRAIRAEMVGGDDLLDGMELVNRLAQRITERSLAGEAEAHAALQSLIALKDLWTGLILEKYKEST